MWKFASENSYKTNFSKLFMSIGILCQRVIVKLNTNASKFSYINKDALEKSFKYGGEVALALSDLELIGCLERSIDSKKNIRANGDVWHSEEVAIFYQGIFLDLVHRLKDKLMNFIETIIGIESIRVIVLDHSVSKILKIYKPKLMLIGIYNEIEKWSEAADNTISQILKTRSAYHHKLSDNVYIKNTPPRIMRYMQAVSTKTKSKQVRVYNQLNKRADLYVQSVVKKQSTEMSYISKSVEFICQKLIRYYGLDAENQIERYLCEVKKLRHPCVDQFKLSKAMVVHAV